MDVFNLAGRLADNPEPQGPTYPAESACWACGTVVTGDPMRSLRWCANGHEEVRWNEKLPGAIWERPVGNERTLFTSCP